MKRILLLLLLAVLTFSCLGQNANSGKPKIIDPERRTPFPYNHFVSCGIQDKNRNLWFGTSDGIYRYDGKLFTNYRFIDGLNVDRVSKMMEDREGNIWFGANGGIVRYDPLASTLKGSPSFTSIKIPPVNSSDFVADLTGNLNNLATKKQVTHIIEDRNGAIWFCAGYNVYRSNGESHDAIVTAIGNFLKTEKVQMSVGSPDDFGIWGIFEDKEGNFLISAVACGCCYNVTNRLNGTRANHPCLLNNCKHDLHNPQDLAAHNKEIAVSFSKVTRDNDNTSMAFTTAFKDRVGNIWVGGEKGAYRYDGKQFVRFTKNDNLSKSVVATIYEDKNGNIWFCTGANNKDYQGSGVFRYDPSVSLSTGYPSLTQFTTKDGLCSNHAFSNNAISTMIEDNTGKIWFGGDAGICCYNPGSGSFTNFTEKDNVNDDHVGFILKDKTGSLWFGTWNLGLYRYNGKSFICFTEGKPGP